MLLALLLRLSTKSKCWQTSFNYTFFGYVAGLALTVFIMVMLPFPALFQCGCLYSCVVMI